MSLLVLIPQQNTYIPLSCVYVPVTHHASVCPVLCLSDCLLVCPPFCLSFCAHTTLHVCEMMCIYLSVCLPICLSVCTTLHACVTDIMHAWCLFCVIYLSVCLFACVCPSVCHYKLTSQCYRCCPSVHLMTIIPNCLAVTSDHAHHFQVPAMNLQVHCSYVLLIKLANCFIAQVPF